jgi:hypothetical protein
MLSVWPWSKAERVTDGGGPLGDGRNKIAPLGDSISGQQLRIPLLPASLLRNFFVYSVCFVVPSSECLPLPRNSPR